MGESDDCTLRWVGLGLVMAVALVLGLASRGMKALLYFIDGCGSIFGGWAVLAVVGYWNGGAIAIRCPTLTIPSRSTSV